MIHKWKFVRFVSRNTLWRWYQTSCLCLARRNSQSTYIWHIMMQIYHWTSVARGWQSIHYSTGLAFVLFTKGALLCLYVTSTWSVTNIELDQFAFDFFTFLLNSVSQHVISPSFFMFCIRDEILWRSSS